jgi:cell division protease FtsH
VIQQTPQRPFAPAERPSRPKASERTTRKPAPLWDRIKILLFLALCWLFALAVTWSTIVEPPGGPFIDAVKLTTRSYAWIWILAILECLRQLHYLIEEHSKRYYRFWTVTFAKAFSKRNGRMNDWTRYRLLRAIKIVGTLLILGTIVGQLTGVHPPWLGIVAIPARIVLALPLVFQLAFGFLFGMLQFLGIFVLLTRGGVETYMPDDIETRFTDVWGQDHVLAKVKENMVFLEDPKIIEDRGGYVPRGILLYGPPGTGKTLMAQAMAGETEKPFVFVEPGAFINTFFGIGLLKMWMLWRKLRKLALRYGGVIGFFDEADSLGNRGQLTQQPGFMRTDQLGHPTCNGLSYLSDAARLEVARSTMAHAPEDVGSRRRRDGIFMGMGGMRGDPFALQRLLTEMDGLKKPRGFFNRRIRRLLGMRPKPPPHYRILVIMATNLPQALDEALLRPGRIDRMYRVGYTSKEGRRMTYEGYFAKVQHSLTPEQIDKLAVITPYYSGAKVKDLVNESLIQAIGRDASSIEWQDVIKAKHLKELGPPEDVEYIDRERHAIAVHEACHAVSAYRARRHMTIDMASIEKGSGYLGLVASVKPEDQYTTWKTDLESDIMVSVASLAGERLFFHGDSSSGVSGDLETATRVATGMEGYLGMGKTIAVHGVTYEQGIGGSRPRPDRPEPDTKIPDTLGQRIEERLDGIMSRTTKLLDENRHEILAVAYALETHKTLAGDDVIAVIEGTEGPIVDGTRYHTDDFKRALVQYHTRAAEAHEAHADVAEPLPVLIPAMPVAVVTGNGQAAVTGATGSPPRPDPS